MSQQFIAQGRVVWGNPAQLKPKKDARTKQTIMKDGQPVMECAFGLAIEKNMFYQQVKPYLEQEVRSVFPNGVPKSFAWKFKDADSETDDKGRLYAEREGQAGCCVLSISTQGFAPTIYKQENGVYRQMSPEEVKCGDYLAVNITVKFNGQSSPNTPGLYINPNGIVHIGYGQEISSGGGDPEELFAGFQAQLPPGASATPVMGSAPMPTEMQPQQPQQYGQPQQPQQYGQPQPLPAPAHDFVQNAMGQPQQYAPAANMPGMPQGR